MLQGKVEGPKGRGSLPRGIANDVLLSMISLRTVLLLLPILRGSYTEVEMWRSVGSIFQMVFLMIFLGGHGCTQPLEFESPLQNSPPESDESKGIQVSVVAGHESVQLAWSLAEEWQAPWVHYRLHMPGEPWDGTEASEGPSPLKNVGEGVFELTGLPNGVLVYVAVSAENAQGERSYSPFAKAQPERKLGERVWIPAGGFPMGRMEEGAS